MMKLSDYVMQFLADREVKHIFLVTGGGAMHLNASLAGEKRSCAISPTWPFAFIARKMTSGPYLS